MSTLKHAVPRYGFCCQFKFPPATREAMLTTGGLRRLKAATACSTSSSKSNHNASKKSKQQSNGRETKASSSSKAPERPPLCEWSLLPAEVLSDFENGKQSWKPIEVENIERSYSTRSTTLTSVLALLNSGGSESQLRANARDKLMGIIQHNLDAQLKLVEYTGNHFPMPMRMVRLSGEMLPLFTVPKLGGWLFNNSESGASSSTSSKGVKGGLRSSTSRVAKDKTLIMSDPALDAIVCDGFRRIGDAARKYDVRLSFHPSPAFVALASDKKHVVENSLAELNYHAKMIESMGYGQHFQDMKCNVHIAGKLGPDAIRHSIFPFLSDVLKNTLTFENDERTYGLDDVLSLSDLAPVVIDVHHCWIHEGDYFTPESLFVNESSSTGSSLSSVRGKGKGKEKPSLLSGEKLKSSKDEERFRRILASWSRPHLGSSVRPVMHYSQPREELFLGEDAPLAHLSLGPNDPLLIDVIVNEGSKRASSSPRLLNKRDLFGHSGKMWNHATNSYVLGNHSFKEPRGLFSKGGTGPSERMLLGGFSSIFDIMFEAKQKSAAVVDFYQKYVANRYDHM